MSDDGQSSEQVELHQENVVSDKTLRRLLDSCFQRCKAHDAFKESVRELAQTMAQEPEGHREALLEIAKLCDVPNVEWNKKGTSTKEETVAPAPVAENPDVRPQGIVHGGTELPDGTTKK